LIEKGKLSLEDPISKYLDNLPKEWQGIKVPEILLSGHHENIEKWRREQSIKRTKERRPDLLP
ncbi:MAG: hypothetical protein RR654_05460, partial [Oscillospiraceae bacterium]